MSNQSAPRIHLSVTEAGALSERALSSMGFEAREARIITDHVIEAALCGYEYSGFPKLLNIPGDPRFEAPRAPAHIVRDTSVSTLVDGGNTIGMLAMHDATRVAIERAKKMALP